MKLMSTERFVSTRGQVHSLSFDTGLSYSMTMTNSSSKATKPIVTFHIEPPGVEETKICSDCLGHTTNMASMPIYGHQFDSTAGIKKIPF